MATPKVFVSSTCYDLMQIRDSLFDFIKSYYYDPILSEKGDVFFHPDLHTHESCISELENCQLFILIIGGRFGGSYKLDSSKSVTNAEYEAAKLRKIPIFTFIKRDVYEDHRVYQKNKHDSDLVKKINFPSIERQDYATNIFQFIDAVRFSDVNNSVCPFEYVNQIKDQLGKQFAGLMYDFLSNRIRNQDQLIVSHTLDNLTLINRKTEELVENIYKQLKPTEAAAEIEIADRVIEGSRFFRNIFRMYDMKNFQSSTDSITVIDPKKMVWYDYLVATGEFELVKESSVQFGSNGDDRFEDVILWLKHKRKAAYWPALYENYPKETEVVKCVKYFEIFKTLNMEERRRALEITTNNIV